MLIETDKFTLTIPSSSNNVSKVQDVLDYIKDTWNISDETYANIELVLGEALSNAIMHGNKGDAKKSVKVFAESSGPFLNITVIDEGSGFNHNMVPDPTLPENIENPSGRGVYIIKQLSDLVVFSDDGRCVEMSFKI